MKVFLTLMLMATSAYGVEIKLENLDQTKLAQLLERLPLKVKKRSTKKNPEARELIVNSVFPDKDSVFSIACEAGYYNESRFLSFATCKFKINENDVKADYKNDEYKIIISDPELVDALYNNITYQELRSFGRDEGLNYEGEYTNIFHYYFKCSSQECFLKAPKLSVPETAQ